MKNILSWIKQNWILALVIVYILSPIDFIPLFGGDDAALLVAELARRYLMSKIGEKKQTAKIQEKN